MSFLTEIRDFLFKLKFVRAKMGASVLIQSPQLGLASKESWLFSNLILCGKFAWLSIC